MTHLAIGTMLHLSNPVPNGTPIDIPWFTTVRMERGAGSWPHFHEVGDRHPQQEAEFFQWRQGEMIVFLRASKKTYMNPSAYENWQEHPLDSDHLYVFVPPGWYHAICMKGMDGEAEFIAYTLTAHLLDNENGGNIHRIMKSECPPTIIKRIKQGLIV